MNTEVRLDARSIVNDTDARHSLKANAVQGVRSEDSYQSSRPLNPIRFCYALQGGLTYLLTYLLRALYKLYRLNEREEIGILFSNM